MDNKMDGVTKAIVIVLCSLLASVSSCSMVTNYQDNTAVGALVKAGADPIDALCSIRTSNSATNCGVRIALKGR